MAAGNERSREALGLILGLLLALLPGAGLRAAEAEPPAAAEAAAARPAAEAGVEAVAETVHQLILAGQSQSYRVSAGWLSVNPEEVRIPARIFFVAYRLVEADPARRPLTFVFNGGPGAASLWLHLGLLGPRRVRLEDSGTAPPPPARLEPNPNTWLAFTDLVFVDPVGTGFSRPQPDDAKSRREFYEVKKDLASLAAFLHLYLGRTQRWSSPKFLVGESYGATRAAGLGEMLLDRFGIDLNGLILISPVLDFSVLGLNGASDLAQALALPSFGAAARRHGRVGAEFAGEDSLTALSRLENFAETEYLGALFRGDRLAADQRAALIQRLASATGLTPELLERHDLRVPTEVFRKELRRAEGLVIGRMDAEVSGPDPDPGRAAASYDPALDSLIGTFAGAINHYLSRDLQVKSDLTYEFLSQEANRGWDWSSGLAGGQGFLEVSGSIRNLLAVNRHLRIFVAAGVYDLATPYAATHYALDHLRLGPDGRSRLDRHLYWAGHMMYTRRDVGGQLTRDAAAFYQAALENTPAPGSTGP